MNENVSYDVYRLADKRPEGVSIHGDLNNDVLVAKELKLHSSLVLHFRGRGARLVFNPGFNVKGLITVVGDGARATFGGGSKPQNLTVSLYHNCDFSWGDNCTSYGSRIWVAGGTSCTIGDGCLLSEAIQIRTTDHHAIIDLDEGVVLNPPASVNIGNCVWLGEGVSVAKGVSIGHGAIIGGRSLVNRDVPPCELWAGSPARMLRQRVSWADSLPLSESALAARRTEISQLLSSAD